MNSKERILAQACGEKVDRLPVSPWGLGKLEPNSEIAHELIKKCDPILQGGHVNPYLGKEVESKSEKEGNITINKIFTSKGILTRKVKQTEQTSATIEFPFKTPEDVEKFLSLPYSPLDIQDVVEVYFQKEKELNEEGLVVLPFNNPICFAARWFSPEDFCLQWIENPSLIIELTQIMAERTEELLKRTLAEGAKAYRMIGGEFVTTQLGPKAVPPLLLKFDTPLIELIHQQRGVVFYHNHGPMLPFLEDICQMKPDVLDPLEAPPWGDADLSKVKEIIKGRITILGNLDDMEVLSKKEEVEVESITRKNLEAYGTYRHILGGTTSGTFTEKAARNFMAMVEVAEEFAAR